MWKLALDNGEETPSIQNLKTISKSETPRTGRKAQPDIKPRVRIVVLGGQVRNLKFHRIFLSNKPKKHGKTCYVYRFVSGEYEPDDDPTIGTITENFIY